MAVKSVVVTVGTSATLLANGGSSLTDLSVVYLRNDSVVDVYIGGIDVTSGNGFKLPASGGQFPLDLAHGEPLYGIAASPTPVQVLKTRS